MSKRNNRDDDDDDDYDFTTRRRQLPQQQYNERPSCPCKRVNLSLSSLTAAEYGDVPALAKRQRKQQRRGSHSEPSSSSSSSTIRFEQQQHTSPLHLAAQHGHVAATAWLLQQQQQNANNSSHAYSFDDWFLGGATPLHRASFSGAVGTMRLLLDALTTTTTMTTTSTTTTTTDIARRILLAKDMSFGDGMTALHKAVAGGRYLAVQLLLDQFCRWCNDDDDDDDDDLTKAALEAVDAQGRTPRDLAVELRRRQSQHLEQDTNNSVARWDSVAGGRPDWDKCLQLLRTAEFRLRAPPSTKTSATATSNNDQFLQNSLRQVSVPLHLTMAGDTTCLDCANTAEGGGGPPCLTASWEQAFRASLQDVVESSLTTTSTTTTTTTISSSSTGISSPFGPIMMQAETSDDTSNSGDKPVNEEKTTSRNGLSLASLGAALEDESSLGDLCGKCQQKSIVLYRRGDLLVCKKCKRRL